MGDVQTLRGKCPAATKHGSPPLIQDSFLKGDRIAVGSLTKTEDQIKQEQSTKEAFSKIPKEALKLMVLDSPNKEE